ncbi:MAG TPA: tail fiber protein [Xanthobacteraceae bacterium]|jgi:microcystin-dependent protein|nr:tail fiber protein [Xanthobacteraceae bacterium]
MAEPFLSEIRIMSFNFAPKGWALCNGQILPINQNQALFSLLGTRYGGDGRTNFALPDLRGRISLHMGSSGGGNHALGEKGGEVAHTLNISEMAAHTHLVNAIDASPAQGNAGHIPSNTRLLAQSQAIVNGNAQDVQLYVPTNPSKSFAAGSVNPSGGSQPHQNQQPFLALNFCIALQGIFPSQN